METNAYEIRLPEINVQGIYPRAALFEHDCVPNTHRTFDEDLTLVVRAAVDIAKVGLIGWHEAVWNIGRKKISRRVMALRCFAR